MPTFSNADVPRFRSSEVTPHCSSLGSIHANSATTKFPHGAEPVSRKHMCGGQYIDDRRSGCNKVFNIDQLLIKYANVFKEGGFYAIDRYQLVHVEVEQQQLVSPPYYLS